MGISLPSTQKLDEFVDRFVPAELAADRDRRKQARLFLISHLFGPFIGNVVPLALYVLDPTPGYQVAVLALSITGFWLFPFVLKAVGHYHLLSLVSIQNLMFCILWSCFFYGGVSSPTLPWVLTIPILAFFYIGSDPRLRLIVLAMFAINVAVFAAFLRSGHAPAPALDAAALQGLGLVSTLAASAYVAMMALFYAKVLASQSELEAAMRDHLATAAELRRATEDAVRAGAAKADFLAKMSHELRTPLNAVIGYSQLLLEEAGEDDDPETAEDLERINSAGQHLLRLVNEVLDLSKIEAGKMELYNEPIEVRELLDRVVRPYRRHAELAGTSLVLRCEGEAGTVVCDADKLGQALGQLVDNAVKFTRGGSIAVVAGRTDEGRMLSLRVEDTGIGIAPDQLPSLFEQFTVGDDSSTSKYGGTGLGLALGRKLCRLMGGDILAESREGEGSAFTILVPAHPDLAPPPPQAASVSATASRYAARLAAIVERGVHSSNQPVQAHA